MALAFDAAILDGRRCKICTVTCLDDDPAADLAVAFLANGMTDFQGASVPLEAAWCCTAAAADASVAFAITALAATGFTVRKLTATIGADARTIRVMLRLPRGIFS